MFLTDDAIEMFDLIVQSSYYPHFFELEAHQPFSVQLMFHILQQENFPYMLCSSLKTCNNSIMNEIYLES